MNFLRQGFRKSFDRQTDRQTRPKLFITGGQQCGYLLRSKPTLLLYTSDQ